MLSVVTGPSPWYFSGTDNDPHRSGFKFQTAVPPVLRVTFQVQLSFVLNLLNGLLLWLPNVSLNLLLPFRWLQLLPVQEALDLRRSNLRRFRRTPILKPGGQKVKKKYILLFFTKF